MINILYILLFLTIFVPKQKDPRYNKQGYPSTYGIDKFIKENQDNLVKEYEYLIGDTLYDVNIFTENLSETSKGELGMFYLPDYIIITDDEVYVEYEFKNLSKFRQRNITFKDRTVKAVVFHELTHAYLNQIEVLMTTDGKKVSREYQNFNMIPISESAFGVDFIEEGICEYTVYFLNESIDRDDIEAPETIHEVFENENNLITYRYSVYFLKDFLDKNGFKNGIKILLQNKPPTYKEILYSPQFFNRLQKN